MEEQSQKIIYSITSNKGFSYKEDFEKGKEPNFRTWRFKVGIPAISKQNLIGTLGYIKYFINGIEKRY